MTQNIWTLFSSQLDLKMLPKNLSTCQDSDITIYDADNNKVKSAA